MTTIAKTARLPEELMKGIQYRTEIEGTDESSSIRDLLSLGLQEYAIKLYKSGRMSLREAAKLAGLSMRDMLDILWEHGVKGNITYETQKRSLEIIKEL
ncbi:MAG: UPF0175 family protein [Candidatus Aenigmarchaeota archaeon]|nr:UPF0175 family protein [Candidatus Aenigmarchaeota archaeon]